MPSVTPRDVSNYLKVTVEEPGTTQMMKDLQLHLPGAVLLFALAILERGGLSAQDGLWAAQNGSELDKAPLFGGGDEISHTKQFKVIAKGIAILAHFPQGVTLFGMHFEVDPTYSRANPVETSSLDKKRSARKALNQKQRRKKSW